MQEYIVAAVTLLVGFVALEVYRRQKRDQRKTAARIILVEIENAERQLSMIKEAGNPEKLSENTRLMSTASWEKYRHLFGQTFTSREWDTISDFYNRCAQYDKAVEYDSSSIYHDIEAIRTGINNALSLGAANIVATNSQLSLEEIDAEYRLFKEKLVNTYMARDNLFTYAPNKPLIDATTALKELNTSLSLTSVGDKLRRISRPGIWQRLLNK